MIEILKKQLFNSSLILTAVLLIPLLGLFVFATFYEPALFASLSFGLLIGIFLLFPLRSRYINLQAEAELKAQDIRERINLLNVEIHHEELAIKSFQDKIVNFSQLKGMIEKLSQCLYLEDTIKTLSAEVGKLFQTQDKTIILYLFHSKTGDLGISSSKKGQMRVNLKSKRGDIFDKWVVKTMQPLLITDTKSDYRFDADKTSGQNVRLIRSLISVPLMVGDKALGILRIDNVEPNKFTVEDLRFLTTVGDIGAVSIENAQLYERVEQLAIRDSLTNLYLRRYLMERFPEEISRQIRHGGELSLLMMDLDYFKQYNDKFGHVAGDILLRTMGLMLQEFFNKPGNLVCRYGGEEFAVLLPDCSKAQAVKLAEEAAVQIAQQSILLRREKTHITVSVGVASFPKDGQNPHELIHRADQALYNAKETGRNKVSVA
ncbi:MAG: sensor domain-containing diguanylate cyclase [Candidatus Omnitrophica bacterium]|nr:sensor domain-containing diguanylate cyclase [Candidatus Omnitrophota bacterium]